MIVNVQLIDTARDQHIWAERYDRTLADSITLQGELASEIARALQATLSPEEKARVETKATDNPEAYVSYLRGREAQLGPNFSSETLLTAESFYKQALALDPKFVLARAQLCLIQASLYESFEPTNALRLAEARANAEEALHLDANSGEAHLALARCAHLVQDEVTTRRELAVAVHLLPNNALIARGAAGIQSRWGWNEEAAANYKRSVELGPRDHNTVSAYGQFMYRTGQEAEARMALDRALVLAPESVNIRLLRTNAEISWSGDIGLAKAILAALPAGQDPDGKVTSAYATLAVLERNYPAALKLVQGNPSETLPWPVAGGLGSQEPKALSEGAIRVYAGNHDRAYECFDSVRWIYEVRVRDKPQSAECHANLALVYAWMGWKEPAMAEAARAVELETQTNHSPPEPSTALTLAYVYTWAAEADPALKQIQKWIAFGAKDYSIHNFRLDPMWDPLRNDERFEKIVASLAPK